MPVSKKRKKKSSATPQRNRSRARSTFTPTALPEHVDVESIVDRLAEIRPEALPSVGLSEWYMASTPVRNSNQCVAACATVMTALRHLGLEVEPVSLQLEVPNRRGGTTRYGHLQPHHDTDGNVIGHVGLLADDHFIDVTASQYPEVARGGIRVIYGPTRGQSQLILDQGGLIPVRTRDGQVIQYTVGRLGSADAVMMPLLEKAIEELAQLAFNTLTGYTKALSTVPLLLERVNTLAQPRHARFVRRVNEMTRLDIVRDEAGNWHTVPTA